MCVLIVLYLLGRCIYVMFIFCDVMRAKAGLFERETSWCRTKTLCICILCLVFVIKH